MSATPDPIISRHVAVIGAGASGLVTARELRREGHTVVVFERGDQSLLSSDVCSSNSNSNGTSNYNYKELRRAMAFLLESPQVLTACGMVEFMAVIIPMAVALELQASMLKKSRLLVVLC
nr:flavin-containing monooxygenase fmo gs-ox1 [Quercus suber]